MSRDWLGTAIPSDGATGKKPRAHKARVSVKASIELLAARVDPSRPRDEGLILATRPKFGHGAVGPSPSKRELETFVVARTS